MFRSSASEPHTLGGCCVASPSSVSSWSRPSASGRRAGAAREQRSDGGSSGGGGGCSSESLRHLCGSWWRRWLAWTRAVAAGPPPQPQHPQPRQVSGRRRPAPPPLGGLAPGCSGEVAAAGRERGSGPGLQPSGSRSQGERSCVNGKGKFPFLLPFPTPTPASWGLYPEEKARGKMGWRKGKLGLGSISVSGGGVFSLAERWTCRGLEGISGAAEAAHSQGRRGGCSPLTLPPPLLAVLPPRSSPSRPSPRPLPSAFLALTALRAPPCRRVGTPRGILRPPPPRNLRSRRSSRIPPPSGPPRLLAGLRIRPLTKHDSRFQTWRPHLRQDERLSSLASSSK